MRRLVPRVPAWLWLGALCVGLALSALVLGRRSSHLGRELLQRSAADYARGDWNAAADLARQRLKTAKDDPDALRLLARSLARLGRDVQANALFARLGSTALQTEDLYLVGLGLNRAGQKDAAQRTWEKALGLEPGHAETLEQLVMLYTASNRLVEAALLAGRLALVPGWELRGTLDSAALRFELSDPAAAAAALRAALQRPEAEHLDRPILARYRKLLARSLLRTAQPGQAREVLNEVLRDGSDAEASWLLSRAWLQEGKTALAGDALKLAGSYRAVHPLELEPSPFVGEERCAGCHRPEFAAHRASRHASTLVRDQQLADLPYPDHPIPDPNEPAVIHEFVRAGGRVQLQTEVDHKAHRAVIEYAFGSPDRYVSLVGRDDHGRFNILRLSYYHAGSAAGWVRTTGHAADAGGGRDFLGKPLDPADGVWKCLFCHATVPKAVLDRSGPESADRGIGCERCHGPGGNHERAVAAKFPDLAIVGPAQATAEGRLRLCGQCHAFHQELPLPRTDPYWIRFQGTTLAWSRCYTESAGSFDCLTCHDPHHDGRRTSADYEARCLNCHSAAPAAGAGRPERGAVCPVNPSQGCVACHMPRFQSEPLHATFADHYIRVHAELNPQSRK